MEKEFNHPPINFGKTGVLIINLGTPDSTSWLDIRKYLKEFLSLFQFLLDRLHNLYKLHLVLQFHNIFYSSLYLVENKSPEHLKI